MKNNHFETVILNAPDPGYYNLTNRIKFDNTRKIRLIANSWSKNPRKGFDIYTYLDEHLDFNKYEMIFIGNAPVTFKNIVHQPPMPSKVLSSELKKSDIFIATSLMEACSNSLIEAMHCGCVPVARNNTSHPEILGRAGLVFNGTNDIIEKIDKAVSRYSALQSNINLPTIKEVAEQYYSFIKNIYQNTSTSLKTTKHFSLRQLYTILLASKMWQLKNKFRNNND